MCEDFYFDLEFSDVDSEKVLVRAPTFESALKRVIAYSKASTARTCRRIFLRQEVHVAT